MRHVCSAALGLVLVSAAPFIAFGQGGGAGLSVTNLRFVSEVRYSRTQWFVTYGADLVNTGGARGGVTATATSTVSTIQIVPGQGTLHFAPVPANSTVPSIDTFTLLIDRSVPFDISTLIWSFLNPVANGGPNQSAPVGSTVTLNGSACLNPSGVGTLAYHWNLDSRPAASQAALTNPNNVVATMTLDVPGTYLVSLTADNGAATDKTTVLVSTVNSPPVARAGANQTVALNSTVTLNGSGSSDADGNSLTYKWGLISYPVGSAAALSSTRSVSTTFVVDKPGTYIAQLIVNDSLVDSSPSTVMVATVNTPPVANAGPNQTVTAGALVQLNGAGSTDVDGDPLTYRWTLITLPAGSTAVLNNPGGVNPTFTADVAGLYVAQLIVNDGKVDAAPSTVSISTNVVQAPTANVGANQTVTHGAIVNLNAWCTDPQNLPCTARWSFTTRPANSTATLSATNIMNPSFVADLPGTYVAQVVVSNGILSSQPATVTISTTNSAPVADAGQNRTVFTHAVVALDGSHSFDADHDPLTYHWSFLSRPTGSTSMLQAATAATPSFFADVEGTYVIQLIVNDGFANSAPATVTISASSMGIILTPNPLNLFNSPATLTITLSAPAGDGGTTVVLSGFDPAVISAPSAVIVPSGSTGFNVTVTPVGPGSTNVIASAAGFQPATAAVTVATPKVTITSNFTAVGIGRSITAVATLNAPAPPGGATVTLSGTPGIAGTDPASLVIPAGQTSGTFSVTGIAEGSGTIQAAAPGYTSGTLSILVVKLGSIGLPVNVTVGPGQSVSLNVALALPAPAGGVTISLASGNTAILTVPSTVFIPQGATAPTTAPLVTGVAFGSATVTASATGFTGDSQTVKVGASLSFSTQATAVSAGGVLSTTLLLSAPAPAGGLTITLTSSSTANATVPATVTIDANTTSVTVPITGVAAGTATITASSSSPNVTAATVFIAVEVFGSITVPSNLALSLGQQTNLAVALSAPAPQGGVVVTLSSASPANASVSPSTVTIAAGHTTPDTPPQVSGAGLGSAAITASAQGYTPGHTMVSVSAALSLSPATVTLSSPESRTLTVTLSAAAPSAITVNLSAAPTGIVSLPASVTIAANATTATFNVTPVAAGATTITAAAPSPVNISSGTAGVTVQNAGSLSLPSTATVGLGQSLAFPVTLSAAAPAGGVTVNLSSSNASRLSISPSTVTVPAGQTQAATTPQITGNDLGPADITASASLYTSAVRTVQVIANISLSPASLSLTTSETKTLTLTLSAPAPAGGLVFQVSSNHANIASVSSATATIAANATTTTIPVSGVATGSATIRVTAPNLADATADVTVTQAIDIIMPATLNVAPGDIVPLSIRLAKTYPSTVFVTLTTSDASKATTNPTTITFAAGQTLPSTVVQVAGASAGTTTITATSSGITLAPASTAVTVGYSLTLSPSPITILGTGATATLNLILSGPAPAGGIDFSITSSNPGILNFPSGVSLSATSTSTGVRLTSVAAGSTVLHVSAPGIPEATVSVTVVPPGALVMTGPATLALSQTANLSVSLSSAAPPAGVTIQFASTDSSKVSLSPSSVTIAAGATTPATTVQITGSNTGSATISASASGYTAPTPLVVTVSGSVSWVTPTAAITGAGNHATLQLQLATAAPAAGQIVNLTSSAPGVATVPATATFVANGSNSPVLDVPVTAVGPGTATIHASGTNIPDVTATVTVIAALSITTNSLPDGTVGTAYNATVAAAGGVTPLSWSATGLPAWLTLNATTGALSGTPTSAGTTTVTFTVTDSTSPTHQTATKQLPIVVSQPNGPSISTVTLPPGTAGTAYSTTVGATGGATPYTWSATGLPAELSMNSTTGVISGTPVAGTSSVTVTVTDSTTPTHLTNSKAFTLTVNPAFTITTATLPAASVGVSYSATLAASGGTGSLTWSASGLPAGLGIAPATGLISGTPSAAGTSTVTVTVTDSTTPTHLTATRTYTMSVSNGLTLSPTNITIRGNGNQATLTLLLSTPAPAGGLEFTLTSSNTAVATVSPFVPFSEGTSSVSARVTSVGAGTAVIHVTAPGFGDTTANVTVLPPGAVTLTGPATIGISQSGTLNVSLTTPAPAGGVTVNLASSDSKIATVTAGVTIAEGATTPASQPQINAINTGTATITATASGFSAATPLVVNVNATVTWITQDVSITGVGHQAMLTLRLSGAAPTDQSQGVTVNLSSSNPGVATIQPTGIFMWDGSSAPGITIPVTSVAAGTTTIHASGVNIPDATTTVTVIGPLAITSSSLPNGTAGAAYSFAVVAGGGVTPYSWSASGLPSPLSIDAGTGVISGTPASAGTNTVNVTATDSTSGTHQTVTKQFTLTIGAGVSITTGSMPGGIATHAYSAPMAAAGGTPGYTWTASGLPAGLAIDSTTGTISGTPNAAFSGSVTVTATDSSSPAHLSANKQFTLTIVAALTCSTTTLPNGSVGTAYSASISCTGGVTPYHFSATGLPAGFNIDPSTGVISGTASAAVNATVSVVVTDSTTPTPQSVTLPLTLVIQAGPAVTTSALPNGFTGFAYSATATATGGTGAYTWAASDLPVGLSIAPTTGAISGTPTTTGSSNVTLTVTDSTTPTHLTGSRTVTLTIAAGLTISTTSLPDGFVNASYNGSVAASGGTPSYTWAASGLPAGLSINTTTGAITGTPTATGTASVTFTATDATTPTHLTISKTLSLKINQGITITTDTLPSRPAASPYSATLAATGGTTPYSWSQTGLPANLTLDSSTGAISGTPSAAGTATVSVTVTDATTPTHLTATRQFTLIITPQLSITTTTLPNGLATSAYSATVAATGGTQSYTWSSADLPQGLSINATTGAISGTPAAASTGLVHITVTDSTTPTAQTATAALNLTIGSKVTITTPSLPSGPAGSPYSATLAATGGTPSYTWAATGLPATLTLDPATGIISGTPTATVTATVNVTVTDSTAGTHQTDTKSLTLTITAALAITTTSLPNGVINVAYNGPVSAQGGTTPYAWSASGLPSGFGINATTGAITGTSATALSKTITVTVTDATTRSVSHDFTLTITSGLTITTAGLNDGLAGSAYTTPLAVTGGVTPYTWSSTDLPRNLAINPTTGAVTAITGTPLNAGRYTVHITVTDSSAPTPLSTTVAFALTIASPPLQMLTTSPLPAGKPGVAYTYQATASGGLQPYNWTASGLPAWLSLNNTSGILSGTPPAGDASYTFNLTITDSTSPTAQTITRSLTLVVATSTGTITVTNLNLGQNLQAPLTITLSPAPIAAVTLTIATDNPDVLLGSSDDAGSSTLTTTVSPNTTTVSTYVKAMANSGTAHITASIVGYSQQPGGGTVTLYNSAFVLSSPGGVGASYDTFKGATSSVTVLPARLDGSGAFAETQQLRGSFSISVPLGNSPTGPGTVSPASVAFTGGSLGVSATFSAVAVGVSTITATQPFPFTTPAVGGSVIVTVKDSGFLPCDTANPAIAIGKNLQVGSCMQLTSNTPSPVSVLLQTGNSAKLKFSTTPTGAVSDSINVTVPANQKFTPTFYIHAYDSTGPVNFTASANGYGSLSVPVTLSTSGFAIRTPFGLGSDFSLQLGSPDPSLEVDTVRLDSAGAIVETQPVAGGISASIAVASSNTLIGTIQTSPITIGAGQGSASTNFHGVSNGTTTVTASAAGWTSDQVVVTVTGSHFLAIPSPTIGSFLQEQGTLVLSLAAPAGGLHVTLTSNSSLLKLSTVATAAGTASIALDIAAGTNSANFYMQALGSSGSPTYKVSAPGYADAIMSVNLVPSGVVILGPTCGSACSVPAGGQLALNVITAYLDPTTNVPQNPQALAGGAPLNVTLVNSNTAAGTVGPVVIQPGTSSTTIQFTAAGASGASTTISVTQPSGWTTPASLVSVGIGVL